MDDSRYEKADVVHLLFEYVYIDDSWPELWGSVFSILKMPLPCIEAPTSDINAAARVIWGDAYFENCFESKDYERACDALKGRFVSKRCFEEKLETIFYAGQVAPFETYISKLATQANEPSNCLLASAALVCLDSIAMLF